MAFVNSEHHQIHRSSPQGLSEQPATRRREQPNMYIALKHMHFTQSQSGYAHALNHM